jgi:sulfate adenylyltransferase subunit 2
MLNRAKEIIDIVRQQTDEVLLFHSLAGKDSIALLDLCYSKFRRVVCVFLYLVKDLESSAVYYRYAKTKYPNIEFIQTPHMAYYSYRKYGLFGLDANSKQRKYTMSDICDKIREHTGIEWAIFGFKQSDSLNRRLMLRSYKDGKEAICWATKKAYPLSTYKNKDVIEYINRKQLKRPESYGSCSQSTGMAIDSDAYLNYLKLNFPDDLQKIVEQYPTIALKL